MNEATQEQIKRFWEWCGFRRLPEGKAGYHYEQCVKVMNWVPPDYKEEFKSMPFLLPIDLNNLFKYAVPIAHNKLGDEALYDLMAMWVRDTIFGKDPALALFWAIYKVAIKEE